jgi:hypothetical protein
MIIYLASYPRSGNNWSVNLIRHSFNIQATTIYKNGTGLNSFDPNLGEEQPLFYNPSKNGIAFFKYQKLVDNCKSILTIDLRNKLADDSAWYFIKTHEFPFETYFKNEYIVHVVRNPAAVFWSYANFKNKENPSCEVFNLNLGEDMFGDWDLHTKSYLDCSNKITSNYCRVRYEDMLNSPISLINAIKGISGLDVINSLDTFPDFNYWQGRDPHVYRSGHNDWVQNLSVVQLTYVWLFHSKTIEALGYGFNDIFITKEKEIRAKELLANAMRNYSFSK